MTFSILSKVLSEINEFFLFSSELFVMLYNFCIPANKKFDRNSDRKIYPKQGLGNLAKTSLAFFFFFLIQISVASELVFVTPFPADPNVQPTSLSQVKILGDSARVLTFRAIPPGENPQVDQIKKALEGSPAIKKALELWDLARKAAPAPCQDWIISDGPIPVWLIQGASQNVGPAISTLIPVNIQNQGKSINSSQIILLDGLKTPQNKIISVQEMLKTGLLIQMFCHEIFHGIMADLYRERFLAFNIMAQFLGGPHDLPLESDPYIAFKEGFAEASELWFSRLFKDEFALKQGIQGVSNDSLALALRLSKKRLQMLEYNRCIFSSNGTIKDGSLKSGNTDLSTEGVIGSLMYTLIANAKLRNPMGSIFSVFANNAPTNFFEFAKELMANVPENAPTIRRILLEYTCYTIYSPEAAGLYEKYYLAKKAFLMGKLDRDGYYKARTAWNQWKNEQVQKTNQGIPVNDAVPQPMIVITKEGYSVDLNDEDTGRLAWHLEAFMPDSSTDKSKMAELYAGQIVQKRKEIRVFESIKQLEGVIPDWLFQEIATGYKRNLERLEKNLDSMISARRKLEGI
ncbi:MAG: hypothetical protein HQM08_23460 [Candidatus Riflebacteria bacterium]|nr:hypothetical protein [Candidatus Riflebacteria bacterium]